MLTPKPQSLGVECLYQDHSLQEYNLCIKISVISSRTFRTKPH